VQVRCCEFLVSVFRWRNSPHHVKVNEVGAEVDGVEDEIDVSVRMM
jgi:hypothetical protein